MLTYKFDSNDVPVLGIVLEMAVLHELVVLEYGYPVFIVLHLVTVSTAARGSNELLYGYCVSVEILEAHVGKESYLVVLVEADLDVGGARFR